MRWAGDRSYTFGICRLSTCLLVVLGVDNYVVGGTVQQPSHEPGKVRVRLLGFYKKYGPWI